MLVRILGPALSLLLSLATVAPLPSFAGETDESRPPTELAAPLSEHPVWRALLHQSRRRIDANTRRALEETDFFFHEDGARKPNRELVAALAAFEAADPPAAQAARCRFPARFAFLKEQGRTRAERGPCPELDAWREIIGDVELTLVFPEAFLGNPASMFGHTLLRFDPKAQDGEAQNELLGWTLDYTADAGGQIGAIYMLRGLVGGYRGQFSIAPYYAKTKFYGDWQDRDIWEYPLDIPNEALERILLHVWELREVTLPYYFFTQNCSEKLLEVLEVGGVTLGRGGGFPPMVAPVDTVRALEQFGPDALGTPRLRPSPATQLQEALRRVPRSERLLTERLANGSSAPDDQALVSLDADTRARILTLAYDLLRHRTLAKQVPEDHARTRSRKLLRARSQVDAPRPEPVQIEVLPRHPPTDGHGTARVELAGGVQDRDAFIELRIMPAYHTVLDAPAGFAEGGEIRFLDTQLRYFPELNRVRLHEFTLLDVTTASPWRPPFRPLAWHTEIGIRTRMLSSRRDRGLDTEGVFRAQAGIGGALTPARGLHIFALGELIVEAADGLEEKFSVGPLLRAGLSYSTPKGRYTLRTQAIAGLLTGPRTAPWLEIEVDQRVTLTPQWSATLGGRFEHAYDVGHLEGRLGLTRYF